MDRRVKSEGFWKPSGIQVVVIVHLFLFVFMLLIPVCVSCTNCPLSLGGMLCFMLSAADCFSVVCLRDGAPKDNFPPRWTIKFFSSPVCHDVKTSNVLKPNPSLSSDTPETFLQRRNRLLLLDCYPPRFHAACRTRPGQ